MMFLCFQKEWMWAERMVCFGSVSCPAGKAWSGAGWGLRTRSWDSCAAVTLGDSEMERSQLGPSDELWLGVRGEAILPTFHGTQHHSVTLKRDRSGGPWRSWSVKGTIILIMVLCLSNRKSSRLVENSKGEPELCGREADDFWQLRGQTGQIENTYECVWVTREPLERGRALVSCRGDVKPI